MTTTITVEATRWEGGWQLEIGPDQHTQVTTLDKAERQVRDYLDTLQDDVDHSDWTITITPLLGELGAQVNAARTATAAAQEQLAAAAIQSRQAVRALREAGYSVTDCAAILGISRGRVSQLANT